MTDDRTPAERWDEPLAELRQRREVARSMGGSEKLERHRAAGKLDVRARIDHLLDDGSFLELGTLVGGSEVPADAVVVGSGTIDGRPVAVGAEDYTVKAGTLSGSSNAKRYRIAELALGDRVPLVMLLEGAGYRADGVHHGRTPTDLLMQARCSGHVPVVTAVLGVSAGHGALVAPISDYTVMTAGASIFTAGPPVVAESLGETVTKDQLGGPAVAVGSGLVHDAVADDRSALDRLRAYLRYFPSSAWSYPPSVDASDIGPRAVPELLEIVPRNQRRAYDVHDVVDAVFDDRSVMEIQSGHGPSLVCALGRLGGHPVAVIANQPEVMAGSIDAAAADKAAHFIQVADAFHLPLVFLSDNPGMLPGRVSEQAGVLRSGARMFWAQTLATTPKLEVTLRKAYGFGSMVMAMISFDGQAGVFAYPGATMGAMSASALSRASGSDADLSAQLQASEVRASIRSAQSLGFDEMIDPAETRNVLLHTLERALHRRQEPATPVARVGIGP